MDHAMRLLAILQSLWMQHGFWVGAIILLGLLSRTGNPTPSPLEVFWYRVFLPINTALTIRMLYQCIASRSSSLAAIGTFIQIWLARWLTHILGSFILAALGRGVMNIASANAFTRPFETFGVLMVALAGIWFLLAAIVIPLHFISATTQQIQKYIDQRHRHLRWKKTSACSGLI